MFSDLTTDELEDRIDKTRAAKAVLEAMELQLGVIAKAGGLKSYRAQISDIRKAMTTLVYALERMTNRLEAESKKRGRLSD